MDKSQIIQQITTLLKTATAVQCDLVLTFVKRMLNVR